MLEVAISVLFQWKLFGVMYKPRLHFRRHDDFIRAMKTISVQSYSLRPSLKKFDSLVISKPTDLI
jgi:hypothetical protein